MALPVKTMNTLYVQNVTYRGFTILFYPHVDFWSNFKVCNLLINYYYYTIPFQLPSFNSGHLLRMEIVVGQRGFTSEHRTVGGEEEDRKNHGRTK